MQLPSHCIPFKFSYFENLPTEGDSIDEVMNRLWESKQLITVGINGAHQKGFTHQFSMERADASPLWRFLKSYLPSQTKSLDEIRSAKALSCSYSTFAASTRDAFETDNKERPNFDVLADYLDQLLPGTVLGGFSFVNEGDVLEVLSPFSVSMDDPKTEENESVSLISEYPEVDYVITGGLEYHRANGATVGELDVVVVKKQDCSVIAIGETKLGLRSLGKAKSQLQRFVQFLSELRAE